MLHEPQACLQEKGLQGARDIPAVSAPKVLMLVTKGARKTALPPWRTKTFSAPQALGCDKEATSPPQRERRRATEDATGAGATYLEPETLWSPRATFGSLVSRR
jgi:hypothetical protein